MLAHAAAGPYCIDHAAKGKTSVVYSGASGRMDARYCAGRVRDAAFHSRALKGPIIFIPVYVCYFYLFIARGLLVK